MTILEALNESFKYGDKAPGEEIVDWSLDGDCKIKCYLNDGGSTKAHLFFTKERVRVRQNASNKGVILSYVPDSIAKLIPSPKCSLGHEYCEDPSCEQLFKMEMENNHAISYIETKMFELECELRDQKKKAYKIHILKNGHNAEFHSNNKKFSGKVLWDFEDEEWDFTDMDLNFFHVKKDKIIFK